MARAMSVRPQSCPPPLVTSLSTPTRAFTLLELVVVTALVLLLSLVAIPMSDLLNQREDEARLRQALLEMRTALDRYQQKTGSFPTKLGDLLVQRDEQGACFLRRLPINPLATTTLWQIASRTTIEGIADHWEPDPPVPITGTTTMSDHSPIVDIRCPPLGTGINGIPYERW